MLSFRRLDVIVADAGAPPDGNASVLVCWELVTQHSGLEDTTFTVERSESPQFSEGEVTEVQEGIAGIPGQMVYTYDDITPNLYNFWRRYYYRITATTPEGAVVSAPNTWETHHRPHELAIIERHDFALRYLQGVPSFVFIERTIGSARCTCYDTTAGRSRVSDCTLCLGTGRQRPFHAPIPVYADYNPAQALTQVAGMGEIQDNEKDCWISAYPIIKPADIIYTVGEGILWRIHRVGPVKVMGSTVQQVARLGAIGRDQVEYRKLPQQIPNATLMEVVQEWERVKEERMF